MNPQGLWTCLFLYTQTKVVFMQFYFLFDHDGRKIAPDSLTCLFARTENNIHDKSLKYANFNLKLNRNPNINFHCTAVA